MRYLTLSLLAAILFLLASPLHASCTSEDSRLCLQNHRFQISVEWKDFSGRTGRGTAVQLTSDTGYFWFFDSSNVELVVKVLDGGPVNQHYWVFYGALSNVAYTLTVTDTTSRKTKVYTNPSGHLASVGDTLAFSSDSSATHTESQPTERSQVFEQRVVPISSFPSGKSLCTQTENTLCLNNGRFKVSAFWRDFQGNIGSGHAVSLTGDTGYFWFFSPSNVELVTKALDGRPVNSNFWLFYGALSNVEYVLEVTDTVTGVHKAYRNAPGDLASIADTNAFQDNMNAVTVALEAYDRFIKALDDQADLSSPQTAYAYYAMADPAKDILRCLKSAAISETGATCLGFDPQTASYRNVFVAPEEARRIAALLSVDAASLESLSAGPSSSALAEKSGSHQILETETTPSSCSFSAGATVAWYWTCKALRSDVLTVIEGAADWGCLEGGPITGESCLVVVAAELSIGMLKVIACNTIPMFITDLYIIPSQKIELGFSDKKDFQVMCKLESHPEAGSLAGLIKQTVQEIFRRLKVPDPIWQQALDPLVNAMLERFANTHVELTRTECVDPLSSYFATAEVDIRSGGGVTVQGQTITSGKQEASGFIRPKLGFLAPWPYATATSTPFEVKKQNCTGSGAHKLEEFYFPTSGGPSTRNYTWYITNTACNGITLGHDYFNGQVDFTYPGIGQNPALRCDGKWYNFTNSGSKPECEWTPENPYICTIVESWKTTFTDGVLATDYLADGTGYWRDGQVLTLNYHNTSRYDLATGVFSLTNSQELTHFTGGGDCLDRIDDLHDSPSFLLPISEPTCIMVDECPKVDPPSTL